MEFAGFFLCCGLSMLFNFSLKPSYFPPSVKEIINKLHRVVVTNAHVFELLLLYFYESKHLISGGAPVISLCGYLSSSEVVSKNLGSSVHGTSLLFGIRSQQLLSLPGLQRGRRPVAVPAAISAGPAP